MTKPLSPEGKEALLAAVRRLADEPKKDKAGRLRSGLRRGRRPGRNTKGRRPGDPSELLARFGTDTRAAFALLEARDRGFRGDEAYVFAAGLLGLAPDTIRRHASRSALTEARALRRLVRRRLHDLLPLTPR